jgi:hypothetical protein
MAAIVRSKLGKELLISCAFRSGRHIGVEGQEANVFEHGVNGCWPAKAGLRALSFGFVIFNVDEPYPVFLRHVLNVQLSDLADAGAGKQAD